MKLAFREISLGSDEDLVRYAICLSPHSTLERLLELGG